MQVIRAFCLIAFINFVSGVNETTPATTTDSTTSQTTTPPSTTSPIIIYDTCEDIYGPNAPQCTSSSTTILPPTLECKDANSKYCNICDYDSECGSSEKIYRCEERCVCNSGYSYDSSKSCCVLEAECTLVNTTTPETTTPSTTTIYYDTCEDIYGRDSPMCSSTTPTSTATSTDSTLIYDTCEDIFGPNAPECISTEVSTESTTPILYSDSCEDLYGKDSPICSSTPPSTPTPESSTITPTFGDTCEFIYGPNAPECGSSSPSPSPTPTPSCHGNSFYTNQCLNDTICGPPYFEYKCQERCVCNEGYSYNSESGECVATSECVSEITATRSSTESTFSTEPPLPPTTTPECPPLMYFTNECLSEAVCGKPDTYEIKCGDRCTCIDGYYYDNNTNSCSPGEICDAITITRTRPTTTETTTPPAIVTSIECPPNEHYEVCGTACPQTCTNDLRLILCINKCVPGCFCDTGFVRDESTNKCVKPNKCPCAKDPNSHFNACGTACPRTCANKGFEYIACNKRCERGCFCNDGYVFDEKTKKCILPEECPRKCGKHEEWSIGGYDCACCSDYESVLCPFIEKPGCYCKQGYIKNSLGQCVEYTDCADSLPSTLVDGQTNTRSTPTPTPPSLTFRPSPEITLTEEPVNETPCSE